MNPFEKGLSSMSSVFGVHDIANVAFAGTAAAVAGAIGSVPDLLGGGIDVSSVAKQMPAMIALGAIAYMFLKDRRDTGDRDRQAQADREKLQAESERERTRMFAEAIKASGEAQERAAKQMRELVSELIDRDGGHEHTEKSKH